MVAIAMIRIDTEGLIQQRHQVSYVGRQRRPVGFGGSAVLTSLGQKVLSADRCQRTRIVTQLVNPNRYAA
jgi:hypothetical protein